MKKIEFADIVEAFCKRPAMHTMNGTFAEIVAFLDGYAAGAEVKDDMYHYRWNAFLKWLAVKFHYFQKTYPLGKCF